MRIEAACPPTAPAPGMIMLADRIDDGVAGQQTIGGIDITVRRNAFGRQVDSFEADLGLRGRGVAGDRVHAVFIRAPWVEVRSATDVEVLGLAEPAGIGSSRSGRDRCSPRPSIRSSTGDTAGPRATSSTLV